MQDIENHMDDLLRKAAENYPLNTGDGDWDAVAARLTQQAVPAVRRSNRWKYVLSILFLLVFLFTADFVLKQRTGMVKPSAPAGNEKTDLVKYGPGEQTNTNAGLEVKSKKASSKICSQCV